MKNNNVVILMMLNASFHPKWETDLINLFENEKLFLQSCLSLKDVATRIGTNRS